MYYLKNTNFWMFGLFFFFYFFIMGAYFPFFPIWLHDTERSPHNFPKA
ncbi:MULTISPECIES: MFS transporter [Enterobacteriaceae]